MALSLVAFRIALIVVMLVTGSLNTLSKKIAYDTSSIGQAGEEKLYKKPWTMTLVMFTGEFLCMLYFLSSRRSSSAALKGRSGSSLDVPLLNPAEESSPAGRSPMGITTVDGAEVVEMSLPDPSQIVLRGEEDAEAPAEPITWRSTFICFFPAMCDVGGTTLSGIGLLWTTASLYQMLRGSIIIFTGILSVIFLGRKLYAYHWIAISITTVGIVLVGLSSYEADLHDPSKTSTTSTGKSMLGNLLVILSQLLSSLQMVVEEKFLKKRKLPPEFVVGSEGMWGMLVMVAIVLPIVSIVPGHDGDGVHENAIDAAVMLSHSGKLLALVLAYWVSISFYNGASLAIAKSLSSVHRTLIDACRTILVWSIDLGLFYATQHSETVYGESWKNPYSFIQLGGFVFMLLGTSLYYGILRLSCLYYPDEEHLGKTKIEAPDTLVHDTPVQTRLLRGSPVVVKGQVQRR